MMESRNDVGLREDLTPVKQARLQLVSREVLHLADEIAYLEVVLSFPKGFLGDLYDREAAAISEMMSLRNDLGFD